MAGDRTPFVDFILYAAVVVVIGHIVLFSSTSARPGIVFASAGLTLDVLGALLLAVGLLWQHMAYSRAAQELLKHGAEGAPPGIAARAAVWFGVHFGSPDVRATSPGCVESYVELFWGVVLLALGFVGQIIGLWLTAAEGRN